MRVEPGDSEGDPARARLRRVRLDEEPGALVDLPENLVPEATVRGSPEEPRVPIDAGVEIGYRDTGEEVGDRAHLRAVILHAGSPGPIVVPLFSGSFAGTDSVSGCVENVDPELIKAIRQDPSAYYVNIHSTPNFPSGALRGQLAK